MRRGFTIALVLSLIVSGFGVIGLAITGSASNDNSEVMAPVAPHAPIRIDGDADFLTVDGVTNNATGNGTVWNPWIIENWDINGTGVGYCIYVGNTTDYFVVRNCSLQNASGVESFPYYRNAGLHLYNSTNGLIRDNNVSFNGICLYVQQSSNNSIINNTAISFKQPLNRGVFLYGSENISVKNNKISKQDECISIFGNFNNITNNTVFDAAFGFKLEESNNNSIINNSISECELVGVWCGGLIDGSNNNTIIHNYFIDNGNNAMDFGNNFWDSGYPSGGNYWADYTWVDLFHGPDQNLTGSDGIGDTNYTFATGVDNYPLLFETDSPFALDQSPNGTGISIATSITISWNETMNWTSVENAFNFTDNITVWSSADGAWMYNSTTNVSTFNPNSDLAYNTTYWVNVNITATDVAGNALDQDKNGTGGYWPVDVLSWSFTTMLEPESIQPFINFTSPNGTYEPLGVNFTIEWNETMNWASVNASFNYTDNVTVWTSANGTWTHNSTSNVSVFDPAALLDYGMTYWLTVNTTATDVAGNPLAANFTWNFTTELAPPIVMLTSPADAVVEVNPYNNITIVFSNEMNTTSVEAAFSYTNGTASYNQTNGTFTWTAGNKTASFDPTDDLELNMTYNCSLNGSLAADIYGKLLDGNKDTVGGDNYTWNFTTWPHTPPPEVNATYPFNGAININVNTYIMLAFDWPMNNAITESAFSMTDGSTVIDANDGDFTWSMGNKLMTFQPDVYLLYNTTYTVRLLGTAESVSPYEASLDGDSDGVAEGSPADDFVFNFTTSLVPPTILLTEPENGAVNVETTLSQITFEFSAEMDNVSVQNAMLFTPTLPHNKMWSMSNTLLTLTPTVNLSYNVTYIISFDANIAKDLAGTKLDGNGDGAYGDDFQLWFTTEMAPDTSIPTIVSVFPPANRTDVPVHTYIRVTFSEPMDNASMLQAFTLRNDTSTILGNLSWNEDYTRFIFHPAQNLSANTTYAVIVNGSVSDLDGNPLGQDYSWSFTTENVVPGESWPILYYLFVTLVIILLALVLILSSANKHLRKELRRARVKSKKMRTAMKEAGVEMPKKKSIEKPPPESAEVSEVEESKGLYDTGEPPMEQPAESPESAAEPPAETPESTEPDISTEVEETPDITEEKPE